jgi:hypothetical protein
LTETSGLHTGYIYSREERIACNRKGLNYWYQYVEEIFDELGLPADKIFAEQVSTNQLRGLSYLVVGNDEINDTTMETIRQWVDAGGILICFATGGAIEKLGIKKTGYKNQADDEYTIFAYCSFSESVMEKYLPVPEKDVLMPVISGITEIDAGECEVVSRYIDPTYSGRGRKETGWPALIKKSVGKGYVYYFSFNLPQTVCVLHQGRPVDRDYNGDSVYQTVDGIVLNGGMSLEIPYADYWLLLLQNILSYGTPQPFIHQLPPDNSGNISDFVIYYGGDDEGSQEIQVQASNFMKSRGLPYHINAMEKNEGFGISIEEYDYITKTNGHEVSVHFDFMKPYYHYTEDDIREQVESYVRYFGDTPVVSVNHCSTFTGWAEHARWSARYGLKGDNTRYPGSFYPVVNTLNVYGFGFGTSFPHFVYDDYLHNNERLDFVYLPMTYYEPRIYEKTRMEDIKKLHKVFDQAFEHGRTVNVFLHPVYLARSKECIKAVDEMLSYLKDKKYNVVHMGCDELCLWWFDRSKTIIRDMQYEDSSEDASGILKFKVCVAGKRGVIIKIPLRIEKSITPECRIDMAFAKSEVRVVSGCRQLQFCVLPGEHEVEIRF